MYLIALDTIASKVLKLLLPLNEADLDETLLGFIHIGGGHRDVTGFLLAFYEIQLYVPFV